LWSAEQNLQKTSREDHPMDAQMRVVHQKLKLFFAEPK